MKISVICDCWEIIITNEMFYMCDNQTQMPFWRSYTIISLKRYFYMYTHGRVRTDVLSRCTTAALLDTLINGVSKARLIRSTIWIQAKFKMKIFVMCYCWEIILTNEMFYKSYAIDKHRWIAIISLQDPVLNVMYSSSSIAIKTFHILMPLLSENE